MKAASKLPRVRFSVRGEVFETTRKSLDRFPESYFSAISSGKWAPDLDGNCYKIDRDPIGFDKVIDYLRTGNLAGAYLRCSEAEKEAISAHLAYFMLPMPDNESLRKELIALHSNNNNKKGIQFWSDQVSPNLSVIGSTVIKTSGGLRYNAAALGSLQNPNCFHIQVVNSKNGWIMIGLAPKHGFDIKGRNSNACGFFLYLATGGLFSQEGHLNAPYLTKICDGDIVSVFCDRDRNTISFQVRRPEEENGKEAGTKAEVAFWLQDDFLLDLYPAIELFEPGTSLRLLGTNKDHIRIPVVEELDPIELDAIVNDEDSQS